MALAMNNIDCDIYMGISAGKQLLNKLREAKYSIKIVSPYLGLSEIKKLKEAKDRGVDIQLLTTDDAFFDDYKRSLDAGRLLINQVKIKNNTASLKRDKWLTNSRRIAIVLVITILISILLLLTTRNYYYLLLLIPIAILNYVKNLYKTLASRIGLYFYRYEPIFPIKIVVNQRRGRIHSKVFIIDDDIAYVGSLNFTSYGLFSNYEVRIKVNDPTAVREISKEVDELFNDDSIEEKDITDWGKTIYNEPLQ